MIHERAVRRLVIGLGLVSRQPLGTLIGPRPLLDDELPQRLGARSLAPSNPILHRVAALADDLLLIRCPADRLRILVARNGRLLELPVAHVRLGVVNEPAVPVVASIR